MLLHQIEIKLFERQVLADKTSNFERVLSSPQSELARDTMKNPYVFDFVEMRDNIIEREIEHELLANVAKTLLELGTGFAFIGNQYHLTVTSLLSLCRDRLCRKGTVLLLMKIGKQ